MTTAITNSTVFPQTYALNTDRPAGESEVADFEAAMNASNNTDHTVDPSPSSEDAPSLTMEDVTKAIQDSMFKTMIMEMDKSTKQIQETMREES